MASANTAGSDRTPGTSPVQLPVITGDPWFDSEHRPFILCVEYPLSAEELVAALYGVADPQDITGVQCLCGTAAVTLSLEGLPGLAARARQIRHDEHDGTIESIAFLQLCRTRVAALLERDQQSGAGGSAVTSVHQEDGPQP